VKTLLRFGISGIAATLTHVLVFVALVEGLNVMPVPASVPAFCAALLVSYGLNYRWTFAATGAHGVLLPRFIFVSVMGLIANVSITYAVVDLGGYWYGYALAAVIAVVPGMTFLLSKFWVFGASFGREK
jgi:putative flippase GtrA